jgi:hypothetical protein
MLYLGKLTSIHINSPLLDHDATSASLRIAYNLQAKYQREVWLYKHADFINLNSEIRDDSIAFSTE